MEVQVRPRRRRPRWSWYRDPYRCDPYGYSAYELVRNRHICPIFIPGHNLIGNVATFDSSSVTCPLNPGSIHPAVECVSSPSRPRELFPPTAPQDPPATRRPRTWTRARTPGMQDERLLGLNVHQPRQIRLLHSGIDVRVLVVLEHPEVPVQPHIDTGRLNHARLIRVDLHPPRLELGPDVAIGEQHPETLSHPTPAPTIRYSIHSMGGPQPPSGCSSMVELQLPKLTARVRFRHPLTTKAQVRDMIPDTGP